ncbi:MAG: hypothetical protein ACE5OR_08640 [bacterium]
MMTCDLGRLRRRGIICRVNRYSVTPYGWIDRLIETVAYVEEVA